MSLRACLGFRNWHIEHLRRCLESLSASRLPVVLVDLGSTVEVFDQVANCAGEIRDRGADVRVVRHIHHEWSRSVALNLASWYAGDVTHFVFTDADMIFPSGWLDAALDAVSFSPRTLWLTDSRDLLEHAVPSRPYEESMSAISTPHDRVGEGAAMVVPRQWFRDVHGFDEFYRVWGAEDSDLVVRARWDGLDVDWLPDTFVAHQYHRRDWPTPAQFDTVRANRAYFARVMNERVSVRNLHGWHGDLTGKEVRCAMMDERQPGDEQDAEKSNKKDDEKNGGEPEKKDETQAP